MCGLALPAAGLGTTKKGFRRLLQLHCELTMDKGLSRLVSRRKTSCDRILQTLDYGRFSAAIPGSVQEMR